MSCVIVFFIVFLFFFLPSGQAKQLRVCYLQGLPRLVNEYENGPQTGVLVILSLYGCWLNLCSIYALFCPNKQNTTKS